MGIINKKFKMMAGGIAAMLFVALSSSVNAGLITCQDTAKNYMTMEDSYATGCVASGVGNINENAATDDFLTSFGTAAGYSGAGVATSFTTIGTEYGTWSVSSAVDAIGFKFGTGNTADEWFIFDLVDNTTSGNWSFYGVLAPGAGGSRLSHMQAYYREGGGSQNVPEPASLALLVMGLLGLRLRYRRIRK